MAVQAQTVAQICEQAKQASHKLATIDAATRDAALLAVADQLEARVEEVLVANALDLEAGRAAGLDDALIDRLSLDSERVALIARQVRDIAELPDPIGEPIEITHALQRPRAAQAAGAARRGRDRLRGSSQRDRGCRRAGDQVGQRGRAARLLDGRALERGAGADRLRRGDVGRPARRDRLLDRRGRPLRACRACDPGGPGRFDNSSRRRRAQGRAQGARDRAGDLRGGRQLPRLHRRRGRSRDGQEHRLQRQGPAARGLQRGRDAAGPRRRRTGRARRSARRVFRTPASSCWPTAAPARSPARRARRSARPPTRTGTPSTTA